MPARPRPDRVPAATAPVARVCVDVGLPHLDRPFEYLVPETEDARAQPGVRVRVRFAGQLVDGYLLERAETPEHPGRLAYLERVISAERVLTPEVAALARAVADRYAGTLADVLRLAVPPRHARAEQSTAGPSAAAPVTPDTTAWAAYPAGPGFHAALAGGRFPRAVWTALPGEDWPARYAEAAATAVHAGMGAVLVVADARDLDRLDAALTTALGSGRHVSLSAAIGPAERYRRFLSAARGEVPVVAGTRAAAFAPVDKLGLVAIWDDGDDLHAEPRAPYPHAREVLLTRAQLAGAAALVGGYARSVEAQSLVTTGWAKEIVAGRETIRRHAPAVVAASDDPREYAAARLPSVAWKAARAALADGAPVLVQVPRRGYLPAVACADCHTPARCPHCQGPLALPTGAASTPACRWCARTATGYACPECGSRRLRAAVVGARRTAEELGRAFPGVAVRTSGRDSVLATVPAEPTVVVCTPGAEPVAEPPGYGAVLLLDTWALLTRADLRAGEETLRRWLAAAALARPADAGGRVVVVADGALAPVQALRRFDPGWLAERELAGRRELGFPPTVRMAALTGTPAAIAELLDGAKLPDAVEQLGPVPLPDGQERLLLRTTRRGGGALAQALRAAAGVRSARKRPDPVRLQLDPGELL
jgi:primosomal protein N' (replication factor Y) (superfamily II helicase)